MKLLELRKETLSLGKVCDHCLGRQFAIKYKGKADNATIGAALRKARGTRDFEASLKRKKKGKVTKDCPICGGVFLNLDKLAKLVVKETKKLDFDTFLIGSRPLRSGIELEEHLWSKIGAENAEPLKREVNREIGQRVEKLLKKKAEFVNPDLVAIVDTENEAIELQINSLFIYGVYKKLVRGIPQTKWPCSECGGRGCEKCKFTGRQYPETVEDLVSRRIIERTKGTGTKFSGMGREDIDARMLGGRPFVIEVARPIARKLDYAQLEKEVNEFAKGRVEVNGLRHSSMEEVRLIKTKMPDKTYRALVSVPEGITEKELEKLSDYFTNRELKQATPTRVLHRRADKIRKRRVVSLKCTLASKTEFEATVRTQAGTYIKELISGDEGRTKPSFSTILRKPAACKELDVLEIHL